MSTQLTIKDRSRFLQQLADSPLCVPSREYASGGRACANNIFNVLRRTKFVDRVCIAGSMGKRTGLGNQFTPDFDLVLFCNLHKSHFSHVMGRLPDIFTSNLGAQILNERRFTIKISYGGYNYDICLAQNLVTNTGGARTTTRESQRNAVYGQIASSSNPQQTAQASSTYLAESTVYFLKCQDSFTHSVVRLAKYWNRNLCHLGYISGRSFLIETIAVSAAKACELEDGPTRLYFAFREFLRKVKDIHKANIVFFTNYDRLPRSEDYKMEKPLILDPANPYNNLANNLTPGKTKKLRQAAMETLDRLNEIGRWDAEIVLNCVGWEELCRESESDEPYESECEMYEPYADEPYPSDSYEDYDDPMDYKL